jgi:PAS domain-containing protein
MSAGVVIQTSRMRAALAEERARAAEELRRWKDIFDSIAIGIYLVEPERNTIVLANPAFLSLLGLSEKDIGISFYESIPHPTQTARPH